MPSLGKKPDGHDIWDQVLPAKSHDYFAQAHAGLSAAAEGASAHVSQLAHDAGEWASALFGQWGDDKAIPPPPGSTTAAKPGPVAAPADATAVKNGQGTGALTPTEQARKAEEERRRLLTPDDAATRAKDDATYAARLTLAQDCIKIGGHGNLGDAKDVVEELVKMPIEALQLLKERNTKVVVCKDSVTDYKTELKGVRPRGWKPGSTWDTVPGLNDIGKNEVVIALRGEGTPEGAHVPRTGDGHGAANLVIHEVMHALDLNHLKPGEKAKSETATFKAARDADSASVGANTYLAQTGEAGRQETFAEAAARYYSGDAKLKTEMPHLYDYFAANPFAKKDKGGPQAAHN